MGSEKFSTLGFHVRFLRGKLLISQNISAKLCFYLVSKEPKGAGDVTGSWNNLREIEDPLEVNPTSSNESTKRHGIWDDTFHWNPSYIGTIYIPMAFKESGSVLHLT